MLLLLNILNCLSLSVEKRVSPFGFFGFGDSFIIYCFLKHLYGIRLNFESAEVASGLQLSVTGVLGFRTVHQVHTSKFCVWKFVANFPSLLYRSLLDTGGTKGTTGTCCKHKHVKQWGYMPLNKP